MQAGGGHCAVPVVVQGVEHGEGESLAAHGATAGGAAGRRGGCRRAAGLAALAEAGRGTGAAGGRCRAPAGGAGGGAARGVNPGRAGGGVPGRVSYVAGAGGGDP